jgi:ABC-type sugar transport system ATPase subunit
VLPLPTIDAVVPNRLSHFVGSDVALGVRPEDFGYPSGPGSGVVIKGHVRLVETLGAEQFVYVDIAADPVLTDEVIELAEDTDTAVVETLEHGAAEHKVTTVVRMNARSSVSTDSRIDLEVDPVNLHFFDVADGTVIR